MMTTRATLSSSPQAKRREYEARLRAKAEKLAAESIDPVGYYVARDPGGWRMRLYRCGRLVPMPQPP